MTPLFFRHLIPLFPEISLIFSAIALLLVGVYKPTKTYKTIIKSSVIALGIAGLFIVLYGHIQSVQLFQMLITNPFIAFVKGLLVIGTAISIIMLYGYVKDKKPFQRPEIPVLMIFACVGMMLMVSANTLLSLYVGLELQSLSLYVLAAHIRQDIRSHEAALKYFILGALASGIFLFGTALIYGFTATIDFNRLATIFALVASPATSATIAPGVVIGIVLVIIALCFKVSAVPFHMWTPDVYEGSPTPITAFFSAAPKLAGIAIFTRLLMEPLADAVPVWQQIIILVSALSMLVGALGALRQNNLKRLMAYSSISHVGYLLMGLASDSTEGQSGMLVYLTIYMTMSLGMFACIMMQQHKGEYLEKITDVAGLAKTYPARALVMAIFLLSLAGIPPFAGFFGKFYIFLAAVNADLVPLAIIGVVSSVIGAYYYLRIIKLMYFDDQVQPVDKDVPAQFVWVSASFAVLHTFFFLFPNVLLRVVEFAVKVTS